jgi:predicted alpha/beta superfamily hydrolase
MDQGGSNSFGVLSAFVLKQRSWHHGVMLRTLVSFCFCSIVLVLSGRAVAQKPPCRSTVSGDLRIEHFDSRIFPSAQTLRVWLPPGYGDAANAQRKYPVLYLLDGQNLFDACVGNFQSEWQVDETLTRLIGAGRVEPLIVVGIDAPDDGPLRASEFVPVPDPSSPYAFEPHGDLMPKFLIEEVMPRIAREYRVKTGRANTAIGGSSYGGVAALNALLTQPLTFGVGLLESTSLQVGNGEMLRRTEHVSIVPLRLYIGVGDRETAAFQEMVRKMGISPEGFDKVFARNSRMMAANFSDAGGSNIALKFVEAPEGTHSEEAWAKRFPAAVEFLFPAKK